VKSFKGLSSDSKIENNIMTICEWCAVIDAKILMCKIGPIDSVIWASSKLEGEAQSWYEREFFKEGLSVRTVSREF
jgi:hypothetical protein